MIVNLIAATTTRTGLSIQAGLDRGTYEKGIRVSKDEMSRLQLKPADFHGEWNYTITSRNPVVLNPIMHTQQI